MKSFLVKNNDVVVIFSVINSWYCTFEVEHSHCSVWVSQFLLKYPPFVETWNILNLQFCFAIAFTQTHQLLFSNVYGWSAEVRVPSIKHCSCSQIFNCIIFSIKRIFSLSKKMSNLNDTYLVCFCHSCWKFMI